MRIDSWLKISTQDDVDTKLLKKSLVVPNPEYTNRIRMGFKINEYSVQGNCFNCGKSINNVYMYMKEIPKTCSECGDVLKLIVDEVPMKKTDVVYKEVGNELWIPRGIASVYVNTHDIEDKTTLGDHVVDFKSRIRLGPNEISEDDQYTFVKEFVSALEVQYGAIGQAPPGFGKTICALEVIARLKRPAAILVHKEFLMNQWAERIFDCYDIKQSEIGFVQQDICNFEGKKIVMVMIQSLLARDYSPVLFEYFGTVCVDETHRIAAQEFRKAITMFPARYRMGITATPQRADGLENIFFWHIGDIVTVGAERSLRPKIKVINTKIDPSFRDIQNMYDFRGKQNLNKVITYLVENDERNMVIVNLLKKGLQSGRKIIILSGRLDHLKRLKTMMDIAMTKDNLRHTSGYYIGGMSESDRTISATRQLIYATFQMAEEGLDIPDLDTLFLVTPKSNIKQAVGRILRSLEGKKEPVVVDFSDAIEICINMLRKRVTFYQEMNYM